MSVSLRRDAPFCENGPKVERDGNSLGAGFAAYAFRSTWPQKWQRRLDETFILAPISLCVERGTTVVSFAGRGVPLVFGIGCPILGAAPTARGIPTARADFLGPGDGFRSFLSLEDPASCDAYMDLKTG